MSNCPSTPTTPRRRVARSVLAWGFTLVELMVVLAITAILITTALPMYDRYVGAQARDSQISAFSNSLRKARPEAIKRGMRITLCATSDPTADEPECDGGGALGWGSGWVMFTDTGVAGEIDGNDQIIEVQNGFSTTGGIIPNRDTTIQFMPNGITTGALGATFVFKTKAHPEEAASQRKVCVSAEGVTRLCT